MKKLILVPVLALAFLAPTTAQAAVVTFPDGPTPPVATHRTPIVVSECVATTWRAKHYGVPKTKPGQQCLNPRGRWVPKTWVFLATEGKYDVYLRPGV